MEFVLIESPGYWSPPTIRFVQAEDRAALDAWLSQEDGGDNVHTVLTRKEWEELQSESQPIPKVVSGQPYDKKEHGSRQYHSQVEDPRITLLSNSGPRTCNQYFYSPSYVMENEDLGGNDEQRNPHYNPILGEPLYYIWLRISNPVLAEALELFHSFFEDAFDSDSFVEIPCLFRPNPFEEKFGVYMLEELAGHEPSYQLHRLLAPTDPKSLLLFLQTRQTTYTI